MSISAIAGSLTVPTEVIVNIDTPPSAEKLAAGMQEAYAMFAGQVSC